jgi:hypothetical protein
VALSQTDNNGRRDGTSATQAMTAACVLVRGLHHEDARVAVVEVGASGRERGPTPSRAGGAIRKFFPSSYPPPLPLARFHPAPARFDFASSGFCFHGQGSRVRSPSGLLRSPAQRDGCACADPARDGRQERTWTSGPGPDLGKGRETEGIGGPSSRAARQGTILLLIFDVGTKL